MHLQIYFKQTHVICCMVFVSAFNLPNNIKPSTFMGLTKTQTLDPQKQNTVSDIILLTILLNMAFKLLVFTSCFPVILVHSKNT